MAKITITYDKVGNTLDVWFSKPRPCINEEIGNGTLRSLFIDLMIVTVFLKRSTQGHLRSRISPCAASYPPSPLWPGNPRIRKAPGDRRKYALSCQIGLAREGAGETELGEDVSRPPSEGLKFSKNNANL